MINEYDIVWLLADEASRRGQNIDLNTIQVRQSELATRVVGPKVEHKKRWFHTVVYHRRQQARLNHQYGFIREPSVYLVDPRKTQDPHLEASVRLHFNQQPYLLIHPQLWPVFEKMRARVKASSGTGIIVGL
jgi:hypothetical protein